MSTKKELIEAMQRFAAAEGVDELSKLVAHSLIAFAHSKDHSEIEFKDDAGTLVVRPTIRGVMQLN